MDKLKIFLGIIREYAFVVLPILIMFSVINICFFYKYFFNFDVTPFINLPDTILIAFFSIGQFSVFQLLLFSLITILPILYRIYFDMFKEKIVMFFVNEVFINREKDFLEELENILRGTIFIRSSKFQEFVDINKNFNRAINSASKQELEYIDEVKKNHEIIKEQIKNGNFSHFISDLSFKTVDLSFYIMVLFLCYTIISPLIMYIYIILIEKNENIIYMSSIYWMIWIIITILIVYFSYKIKYTFKFSTYSITAFVLISTFLSIQFTNSMQEGIEIKYNLKYKGTEIIADGKKYISSFNTTYIGRTKEYLFFYNLKLKNTIVVSSSKVTEQSYKSK